MDIHKGKDCKSQPESVTESAPDRVTECAPLDDSTTLFIFTENFNYLGKMMLSTMLSTFLTYKKQY